MRPPRSYSLVVRKMRPHSVLSAFLITVATASQNDTCYFPSASVAEYGGINYVPCKESSSGGVTYCCHLDDICTMAGYCVGGAGVFYHGGCTDKTWISSLCLVLCAKGATLNNVTYP